jgi:hypothetical protein
MITKMPKFKVNASWRLFGTVRVNAKDANEAKRVAKSTTLSFFNCDQSEGSYRTESVEKLNQNDEEID